jgi:coatomer protein complex subunit alpha (xenin)
VAACLFHPHQDLILSVGEDKTIRVWDLNKRTCVQSFKRENDRFWVIAAHPQINLFAAGHDNGVMVFKLERERPASAKSQNGKLYFVNKEKQVRSYDFGKQRNISYGRQLTIPSYKPGVAIPGQLEETRKRVGPA